MIGTRLERPSKRARACERFDFRTRVETDEEVAFVATERRRMAVGAGVREMVRDGRGTSRTDIEVREGRRGAADLGTSGRVVDGAGFGEGIDRKESESSNFLMNNELDDKLKKVEYQRWRNVLSFQAS